MGILKRINRWLAPAAVAQATSNTSSGAPAEGATSSTVGVKASLGEVEAETAAETPDERPPA
ncbi:MAG TPA: hypothetical protein VFA05_09545 [Gaiellaceae bacterium]|nr:hypothetical protein [Gaiellaceae bacterium]